MKILLAGLLERDAAAINILVRMAWRDHQVVSLPRSLSLTIPDQDNTARSCKCCIIDLAGLSLRRYSTENESRLQELDRKSTRLNSSHVAISYAVFCLKKKKKKST